MLLKVILFEPAAFTTAELLNQLNLILNEDPRGKKLPLHLNDNKVIAFENPSPEHKHINALINFLIKKGFTYLGKSPKLRKNLLTTNINEMITRRGPAYTNKLLRHNIFCCFDDILQAPQYPANQFGKIVISNYNIFNNTNIPDTPSDTFNTTVMLHYYDPECSADNFAPSFIRWVIAFLLKNVLEFCYQNNINYWTQINNKYIYAKGVIIPTENKNIFMRDRY